MLCAGKRKQPLKKLNKHIALLLFGIFIFPVLFQPMHVLWHKSIAEFSCSSCHFHYHLAGQAETDEESAIESCNQHCLLCDYEFSITSIPEHFVFECNIEKADKQSIISYLVQPQKPFAGNTSPRAPPVFLV